MPKKRAVVLTLVVAIIFAGLASLAVYRFLERQQDELQQTRGGQVQVVVAAMDIPTGTSFILEQLRTVQWPKSILLPGTAHDPAQLIGRSSLRGFVAGEPILESKLAPRGVTTGVMSFIIPPGKRAVTVGVDPVSGVSGFILPDSYVDVIVTTQPTDEGVKMSRIVLQNMQVLAVGQILEQTEGKPVPVPTVTLAVTPNEAERLAMASNEGRLQLALRKFGDQEAVSTSGITVKRYDRPMLVRQLG